jgi:hypothetical protein
MWEARPGEVLPVQIDLQGFVASIPGFSLSAVESAVMMDLQKSPPVEADEDEIKLVSGQATDPVQHQPGFANIVGDGKGVEFLVWTSPTLCAGKCYRLDLVFNFTDCTGRKLVMRECVVIRIVAV